MQLERIGFYTLSDYRASIANRESNLSRCELVLTDRCNFSCPYCRGLREDIQGTLDFNYASSVVMGWIDHGLKNVRFSGGEPTLYPRLHELTELCRQGGVEHIAISTNGSAPRFVYDNLLLHGVNDFSVSLDACCASTGDTMAGKEGMWDRVVETISYLSERAYTTVGVVLVPDNLEETVRIIQLADTLGVSDIRIIPAAQYQRDLWKLEGLSEEFLLHHPILKYRVDNVLNGKSVRGMSEEDNPFCPLVLDDMAIAGKYHFPCIIYMREQGDPIGRADVSMSQIRDERLDWYLEHNCFEDAICQRNCLDVCVDYNNKWRSFGTESDHRERMSAHRLQRNSV